MATNWAKVIQDCTRKYICTHDRNLEPINAKRKRALKEKQITVNSVISRLGLRGQMGQMDLLFVALCQILQNCKLFYLTKKAVLYIEPSY